MISLLVEDGHLGRGALWLTQGTSALQARAGRLSRTQPKEGASAWRQRQAPSNLVPAPHPHPHPGALKEPLLRTSDPRAGRTGLKPLRMAGGFGAQGLPADPAPVPLHCSQDAVPFCLERLFLLSFWTIACSPLSGFGVLGVMFPAL